MQESAALRKFEEPEFPVLNEEKEPQFGDRNYKKKKKIALTDPSKLSTALENTDSEKGQTTLPVFVTRISKEHVLRVDPDEIYRQDSFSQEIPAIGLAALEKPERLALVPSIIKDILAHSVTFMLILAVTCLCVYKVHLVQNTRDLTIRYNEVNQQNEYMHNEWLSLLAERESLTEYSVIRKAALNKLAMIQPKTEDEVVIDLR